MYFHILFILFTWTLLLSLINQFCLGLQGTVWVCWSSWFGYSLSLSVIRLISCFHKYLSYHMQSVQVHLAQAPGETVPLPQLVCMHTLLNDRLLEALISTQCNFFLLKKSTLALHDMEWDHCLLYECKYNIKLSEITTARVEGGTEHSTKPKRGVELTVMSEGGNAIHWA